ncbi:hypothetical protein B9G55_10935 [Saccharibacillus sp. O16]|nr:hypothetical protein B9G55_10935 [Saccharibacillus sp. O16]
MNFLQRIKDGAGRASERAQSAVEIGRLNSHISDIQREIDVHLLRMGQVFYDNYRNPDTAPAEEEIMDLCTACDLLNEEILELRTRIAELRSERLCECGARLDIDAKSCPHCGRQFAEDEEPLLAPATPSAAASSEPIPSEHIIPAVQLRKPGEAETSVEVEAVHDLVDEPGFERSEERRREERPAVFDDRTHLDQPDGEEEWEDDFRPYEREALRASQSERAAFAAEDEQFETKRYELGAAETEYEKEGTSAPEGSFSSDESEDFRAVPPEDETPEEREERQRRELREIRMRERRKMKEAQQREHEQDAVRAAAAGIGQEEEEADPGYDPEYERRQRERIEREQERQDELDRLIASWNGGISRPDEEEQFIVRRPVGEVVRCQVCGSGLPKGSKWCPHCASEQI